MNTDEMKLVRELVEIRDAEHLFVKNNVIDQPEAIQIESALGGVVASTEDLTKAALRTGDPVLFRGLLAHTARINLLAHLLVAKVAGIPLSTAYTTYVASLDQQSKQLLDTH